MSKYDKEVIKEEINKSMEDVSKVFSDNSIQLDTKPINMVSSHTYAKWDVMSRASGALVILYKNNIFSSRKFKCYQCVCGELHTVNYCPKCGSGTCKIIYEEEIKMKLSKVFLGGTCGYSNWREELIKILQIPYFNPVVEDWTEECVLKENYEKEICNIHLYVITNQMKGVYSIAEAVQSSNTKGKITILHVIPEGFSEGELRSLKQVCNIITSNGGISYIDQELNRTARVLNNIS